MRPEDIEAETPITAGGSLVRLHAVWDDQEIEDLFTCKCLLQSRLPDFPLVDVAWIPSLAVDNWQSGPGDQGVLNVATRLWHANIARDVAVPGYSGSYPGGPGTPRSETGYPGADVWAGALQARGIPPSRILLCGTSDFTPDGKSQHTRSEADSFVQLARERQWRHGLAVCSPFHALRVMLSLVQSMKELGYELRVEPVTPQTTDWAKRIYHSQGLQQLPRHEHIREEWSRIPRYQKEGFLCSFAELKEYFIRQLEVERQGS